MTKIKLCGLSRPEDIQAANALQPACVGFVFAPKSKRYVTPAQAADLKRGLDPAIRAVGVFVNAPPEEAAALANEGVIDLIQLHGGEGEAYLQTLRALTPKPILQAFRVDTAADVAAAEASEPTWSCWTQERAAQGRPSTGPCWRASAGPTSWRGGCTRGT